MKEKKLVGYNVDRHSTNPSEKKIHETFINSFSRPYLEEVVGRELTDEEVRVVITMMQWLGTMSGRGFVNDVLEKEYTQREKLFSKKISSLEKDLDKIPFWVRRIY